jgi:hypothetical protein
MVKIHWIFIRRWHLGLPAAIFAVAVPVAAQSLLARTVLGESADRYGETKVLEGGATIDKGVIHEPLTVGEPVAEGDSVKSQGRGVLLLGDGTRIAFDGSTGFQVAELFGETDQGREVRLRLESGRIRVRIGDLSAAQVRIDTPEGSVTQQDDADVTVAVDPAQGLKEWVHEGQAVFAGPGKRVVVQDGESLAVGIGPGAVVKKTDVDPRAADDFSRWCRPHMAIGQGESTAMVPPEIQYFADDLTGQGHWVFVSDQIPWAWCPANVAADWRPFWNGRWDCSRAGLTWVSADPWGFVTSHFGRWGWKADLGWYWIPGIYYSPAWVAWRAAGGDLGWAPLGFDNQPCAWGRRPWAGGPSWNILRAGAMGAGNVRTAVDADAAVVTAFDRKSAGSRPWYAGRLVATPKEFHDPTTLQALLHQPGLLKERTTTFEQVAQATTGRTFWAITGSQSHGFESIVGVVTPPPIPQGQNGQGLVAKFQGAFGTPEKPLPSSRLDQGTGASALMKPTG